MLYDYTRSSTLVGFLRIHKLQGVNLVLYIGIRYTYKVSYKFKWRYDAMELIKALHKDYNLWRKPL